jgi:hypothetical protein
MTELGNRVHLFAHSSEKEPLNRLFAEMLGLTVMSIPAPGAEEPVLLYRFSNGASISVEFTQEAPHSGATRGGAWLELVVDDPDTVTKQVLEAGLERVRFSGNDHFYFQAPGGQVFRITGPARP